MHSSLVGRSENIACYSFVVEMIIYSAAYILTTRTSQMFVSCFRKASRMYSSLRVTFFQSKMSPSVLVECCLSNSSRSKSSCAQPPPFSFLLQRLVILLIHSVSRTLQLFCRVLLRLVSCQLFTRCGIVARRRGRHTLFASTLSRGVSARQA